MPEAASLIYRLMRNESPTPNHIHTLVVVHGLILLTLDSPPSWETLDSVRKCLNFSWNLSHVMAFVEQLLKPQKYYDFYPGISKNVKLSAMEIMEKSGN